MRTHALGALAVLSLLPSAVASPPVPAIVARAAIAVEPALSANDPRDRALIAYHHAPIHHQEVDRTGNNGLEGRADYVTRIDFDGDWDARNDWENAARYPLPGAAYHSVVETTSHWFVTYMFFHPRDWADGPFETEHENDSEGVLLVVQRDHTRFGRLEAAVTIAHSDFYSYVPASGNWSAGNESVDGVLEIDARNGRPETMQEAGGHALRAHRPGERFDGIVYYPTQGEVTSPSAVARTAPYVLIDVFDAGGVWDRRDDPKLFARRGVFAGDREGACGSGGILCTTNAANAPWGWDDSDDGDVRRGDMAIDPVRLVTRYFRIPEPLSSAYTHNPFGGDVERGARNPLIAKAVRPRLRRPAEEPTLGRAWRKSAGSRQILAAETTLLGSNPR